MNALFLITEAPGKAGPRTYPEEKVPKCTKASSPLGRPCPESGAAYTDSNIVELVEISIVFGNADSPELLQQQSSDTLETTDSCSMVIDIDPPDSFRVSWTV